MSYEPNFVVTPKLKHTMIGANSITYLLSLASFHQKVIIH